MKKSKCESKASNLTRRDLLKKAGQTGLTLAAAQALAPFVLSGCSSSKTGGSIKVGIMHSLSGFMKVSEESLKDAELMALGGRYARLFTLQASAYLGEDSGEEVLLRLQEHAEQTA